MQHLSRGRQLTAPLCLSFFNDSFSLLHPSGEEVRDISSQGIAWESDVNVKFRNAEANAEIKTGANFPNFFHELQQSCSSFPDR